MAEALWTYHDYTTIAPGALSDRLAQTALAPPTRARLLARTRQVIADNLPRVEAWLAAHGDRFSWIRPEAGAIVYTRYAHPINSTALVTRLREEESVLVVPGDQFGMDGFLRLGVGEGTDYVMAGLERLRALLDRLPQPAVPVMAAPARLMLLVVGFGNVSRRLLGLLDESAARLPFTWQLAGVCSRSRGGLLDPAGLDHRALPRRRSTRGAVAGRRRRRRLDVPGRGTHGFAASVRGGARGRRRDHGARRRARRAGDQPRAAGPRRPARTWSPPTRGRRRLPITSSPTWPIAPGAPSGSRAR